MRDLIACFCALLSLWLPARRATPHAPAQPATPPKLPGILPDSVGPGFPRHYGTRPQVLDEHGLALVRPYFVAYEQRAERQRQRERRVAAALAPVGIDYDVALVAA